MIKKRSIAFLISDFQAQNFEKDLQISARRHDLIALSIQDPREMALPKIGFIELEDAETGESILIDTSRNSVLKEYRALNKTYLKKQKDFFKKSGIPMINIQTDQPYIDSLVKFFKEREKGRF